MATKRARSRGGRRFEINVHKPHGVIQPRVQKVGPEHFGIASLDCAKARFRWMLCDFYGKVLVPPRPWNTISRSSNVRSLSSSYGLSDLN
jgi:hypothetical protein